MKKIVFRILFILVLGSSSSLMKSQAHTYLIHVNENAFPQQSRQLHHHHFNLIKKIFNQPAIYLFNYSGQDFRTDRFNMLAEAWVEDINKNIAVDLRTTIPNDSRFSELWHLEQIGAPLAWDITTGGVTATGDSIVLGIFDSGYDTEHPDLSPVIWKNRDEIPNDGIDNDDNGYIDDFVGLNVHTGKDDHAIESHGTIVMGTMGAAGNNSIGITGVTWNSKIMLMSKSTSNLFESDFIEAYNYAISQRKLYNESNGNKGAFVVAVNFSLGKDREKAADHPLWCAVYDALGRQGILGISATANEQFNVDVEGDMPTNCPSIFQITVTSSRANDDISGTVAFGVQHVDLAAPGEDILTTRIGNGYTLTSGTSLSTPQVSGAIALMYAAASPDLLELSKSTPNVAAQVIRELLLANVDQVSNLNNKVASGGRLNLATAVSAAANYTLAPPTSNLVITNIYPLPAQRNIFIEIEIPSSASTQFTLFDSYMTRKVLEITEDQLAVGVKQLYEIPTNHLASGVYFLIVAHGDEKIMRKVIKLDSRN